MDFYEKILKSSKERNSKLVYNLDTEKALKIFDEIQEYFAGIKINRTFTDKFGFEILKNLRKYDIPIIADFKIADIPDTNRILAENAKNAGFDAITVHAFIGADSILAVKEIIDPILIVGMSHEGAKEFISKNLENFCKLALNLKIKAVIAPSTRIEEIKKVREILNDVLIFSPGVGKQGGKYGDAIKAGANFEMIGRSIYESENPKKEILKILAILKKN
ncbi:MAG: orotidine-5'-phosphate decarboxylase [Candidatus Altarchaeaceae archaeon]